MTRVGKAEQEAFSVYRHGTAGEARRSLLDLATLLEAEARDWQGTRHGNTLAFDLALTYLRLSLLAERSGADSDAKRYLASGREWYGKSGQRSRDDQELRQLVASVDRRDDRGLSAQSPGATAGRATQGAARQ